MERERDKGSETARQRLEPLQLVSYAVGEKYHAHTDWFTSSLQTTPEFGGNRLSSFFVYVHASEDIVGGGTQFPLLQPPHHPNQSHTSTKGGGDGDEEAWCEFVNCDASWDEGVVFRPVAGNAVFWRNLKKKEVKGGKGKGFGEEGRKEEVLVGDKRVLHAGLPVQRGSKLGMNIWTREGPLDEKHRSG